MPNTILLATWREPGQRTLEAAWRKRAAGADLISSIEAGLAAAEDDPNLVAIGRGALPNSDGELELDAAIMEGREMKAGAVCALRGILPTISVARKVMEDTPHLMLAGEQARRYAISQGFTPQNLMTAENIRRYEEWKRGPKIKDMAKEYIHSADEHNGDTVTCLGWETPGHVVAASSTSGISWKMPGRVGDSPIVGAGIYADDEVGCAGATGWGEQLWKAAASHRVVQAMERGLSAQLACEETVRFMQRRIPLSLQMPCVVLALRKDGEIGAATTLGEFPLWVCRDGELELRLVPALSG